MLHEIISSGERTYRDRSVDIHFKLSINNMPIFIVHLHKHNRSNSGCSSLSCFPPSPLVMLNVTQVFFQLDQLVPGTADK